MIGNVTCNSFSSTVTIGANRTFVVPDFGSERKKSSIDVVDVDFCIGFLDVVLHPGDLGERGLGERDLGDSFGERGEFVLGDFGVGECGQFVFGKMNDVREFAFGDIFGVLGELAGLLGEKDGLFGEIDGLFGEIDGLFGEIVGLFGEIDGLLGVIVGLLGEFVGLLGTSFFEGNFGMICDFGEFFCPTLGEV